MKTHPQPVPYIAPGQQISAAWLNQIIDSLIFRIEGMDGITVERFGGKLMIRSRGQIRNDLLKRSARALVNSIDANTLSCSLIEPDVDLPIGTVTVAKPFVLQQTPWDGVSWTYEDGSVVSYSYTSQRVRVATSGGVSETQAITPDYATSEHILIGKAVTGLTDSSGEPVVWQDLNTAGRGWARV